MSGSVAQDASRGGSGPVGTRRDRWVMPFFLRYRKALALALALGVATFCFASALMVTSGYLVSASAVVETVLFLHLPLILVRIFGAGKPVLQYLERLTSHDWVLRMTSAFGASCTRRLSSTRRPSARRIARGTCWACSRRTWGICRTCICAPCSPRRWHGCSTSRSSRAWAGSRFASRWRCSSCWAWRSSSCRSCRSLPTPLGKPAASR